MRRAKIVCTLGPSSSDDETITELIRAGMDVARLNFSHGTHEDHAAVYERVRRLSAHEGRAVAILQDLQGPKIRVGTFEGDGARLVPGAAFDLVVGDGQGNDTHAFVTYDALPRDVSVGESIMLDDGLIQLRVRATSADRVVTEVVIGGLLKNRKGMNLPNTRISLPSLTAKDRADVEFGIALGVDYVALSFVRSSLDIHQLRAYMPDRADAPHLIAKIEKPGAVANLAQIISAADGIMVARGDLGVELPPEQVPIVQKRAIDLANRMGKLTITATQMLESMTTNARPTRAEASDVANAIFDGTDAVMLSGETAAGAYPVETVRMMASIIREAEQSDYTPRRITGVAKDGITSAAVAIARAATVAATELRARQIACFTVSGATPRLMKAHRPPQGILAFTPVQSTYNRMALYNGVAPVLTEPADSTDGLIHIVEDELRRRNWAKGGDHVIIIMGIPPGTGTPMNLIKFHVMPYE